MLGFHMSPIYNPPLCKYRTSLDIGDSASLGGCVMIVNGEIHYFNMDIYVYDNRRASAQDRAATFT